MQCEPKEAIPCAEQAYTLQAHYKHVATFRHLHLFQPALLQALQVLPSICIHKVNIQQITFLIKG